MISMSASKLNQLFAQTDPVADDFQVQNVVIDSRLPCNDSLFVAIKGENFDGHDYVAIAREKGALAAVVEHPVNVSIPQFVVTDARVALGQLANAWRHEADPIVIAITGSNGKTTVKEMLASILSANAPTHKTAGNLNNDIGVPLTLFKLEKRHRFAVIEMGANHMGEIRQLLSIADPDIAYINNARAAHVEGFGSVENIIKAKGEMYQFCQAKGLAVFNEDEESCEWWKSISAAQRSLGFSLKHPAEVSARFEHESAGLNLTVSYQGRQASCALKVVGEHNAYNAVAAISLALSCGLSLDQACAGLEGFTGVEGRQQFVEGLNDSVIIDDTYNANPNSLSAAVKVLCNLPGEAWLALGDMAELGEDSLSLHEQSIQEAAQVGVKRLFVLGHHSCEASKKFDGKSYCFNSHVEMSNYLAPRLKKGVNLLVKGSRSAQMEKLVNALAAKQARRDSLEVSHAV